MIGYNFGKYLSHPAPGEEVVITGVSGRYPKCRNIKELAESLLSKRVLTSDVKERWNIDHSHLPTKLAKIDDLDKLDAGHFGIHYRQANIMDPLLRIFLEVTFEAILDAGLHPSELEGSRTGVFVGSSFSDIEIRNLMEVREPQHFGLTGLLRTFVANRISYYLKLKGPSFMIDTACSSSSNALETAFKAIRNGKCDNAIVGGAQLCLHPDIAIQFERLGVLSLDGVCRVFDQDANGYVRGETISCILLQKTQSARRVYGQIIHAKVNTNGFTKQGINFPSSEDQRRLLTEILEESGIHPSELSYLEAHGTATRVGDAEEINAIDEAIARRRDKPLWIGSVKCSIGHSEPASGLGSLSKVLVAFEEGLIPPNINLKKIKDSLHAVLEGRLKIVTEIKELEGQEAIVGINNFGFGGNNCHVLVRRFKKMKTNARIPEDNVPRLVCVSGRTEEAVLTLLNEFNTKPLDYEHVALLHHVFKKDIKSHLFRGFSILSKKGPIKTSHKFYRQQTRLYVYFGQFEYSYKHLGQLLMEFPVFRDTILRINKQLLSKKVNIVDVILKKQIDVEQDKLGAVAVQIGFVELLKKLSVYPTAVYGEHFGKLATQYYYGTLKLEEIVQTAYSCFKSAEKVDKIELNVYFSQELNHLNHDKIAKNKDGLDLHRDSINIKILSNSKNVTILNISNTRLSTKDILLADGDINNFLEFLGSLYERGHNPHLHELYPEIEYPVSRGTSMIAPSVKWHHENTWFTNKFDTIIKPETEHVDFEVSRFLDDFRPLTGHVIDGRNLLPAVEYLRLVWKAFSQYQRVNLNNTPVVFEDCKFLRAMILPSDGTTHLMVVIHQSSGNFEVLHKEELVVSGRIFSPVDINSHKTNLIPFDFDECDSTQILMQDEIYREFYLRGYNYSGLFKGIIKTNVKASVGMIQWENNWTTFIDKMIQMKLLQWDTRLLYVPVSLDRLIIDPIEHLQFTKEENEAVVTVHSYKDSGIIKSGGIEIHGLQAKSIATRKPRLEPVLEKHKFLPIEGQLDLATSIRASIQIILENTLENDFNAIELTENLIERETKFLLPLVSQVLEDIPSIKPNLILSIKGKIENIPGITTKDVGLTANSNLSLIVGNRLLEKSNVAGILNALNKNGFVLTRENVKFATKKFKNIEIIAEYLTGDEKIILFRKPVELERRKYIEILSDHFKWLADLQQAIKSEPSIVVYSQNQEFSGLMGFINCLRREPGHSKVTCFLMMEDAPKFDPEHPFYQNQLKKNLAINVYKNSKWGTYRHLLLDETKELESEHVRVNTIRTGDLSSLKWIKGPLTQSTSLKEDHILIQNCYSGLNFKDVMIASGRLRKEAFGMNRLEQECWLGLEFAGVDKSGKRVAGMVTQSGLSTLLAVPIHTLWQVPDSWTLEDAATVTVVYLTVIYSLLKITVVKPGVSILIHSATGGVGLAALNVCLYHGCNIFVTVGSKEKRDYLKKHYPQIPESHIGNSRDTSFEEMIKTETKGRGVDIVLNSLAEEKLIASVRCLAVGGNFVEIGKYDLANNNALNLLLFEKQITYHGVGIDAVRSPDVNKWMINTLEEGIRLGFVQPLPRKVFKPDEIETAFRYMTTGKHIGKVLIKTRENSEEDKTPTVYFKGLPRFYCNPDKCYIIVGGLGGIGLELADWLILKGARKLVLVTSTGIKSGWQCRRLSLWASYNAKIHVSKTDVTTKQGCIQLIKEAHDLGSVDAIFNLAVVLQDALFEDQTEEKFYITFAPKVYPTKYLDEASRDLCPDLSYFVVFSSVSCGRGNAGQTNYGMANSIMERICEKRKRDGLPALAIQWGAIGDVGLVAQMQKENKELVIGGTLQQRISSCLEVLDTLLTQDSPIVSSMVVAEKTRRNFDAESPTEAVASILGIKDMKMISPHATLAELGMDSMMGTEVVQVLEKDFEIYVTAKDVRSLTFTKLTEMKNNRTYKETQPDKGLKGTNLLLQYLPENRHNELIKLPSLVNEETADTVFVFSGIEGVFKPLEQITKNIKARVFGVPYNYDNPEDTIEESAKNILPHLKKHVIKQTTFRILGYSYGVLIALEVAHLLEKHGYIGSIVSIDGSPAYSVAAIKQLFADRTEAEFQTSLIFKIISIVLPIEILEQNKEKFLKCNNFDERLDLALAMIPPHPSKDELDKQGAIAVYKRFKAVLNYNFVHDKIKSNLNLIKAKYPMITEIDNDYKLSEICEQPVQVHEVDGDHATMLSQSHLVKIVNNC